MKNYRRGGLFYSPRYSPDATRLAYSADLIGNDGVADRDLFVSRLGHPQNLPPRFVGLKDTTVKLGQPFFLTLNHTEPDAEPVTFSAAYLPPGASLVGNLLTWNSPVGNSGDAFYVVFRVQDPAQQMDSRVVRLELIDPVRAGVAVVRPWMCSPGPTG